MPRFYKWGGAFELDFATILANLTALISQITPHQMQTLKDSNQINPHEVPPNLAPLRGAEKEEQGGSSASALLELEAENGEALPLKVCRRLASIAKQKQRSFLARRGSGEEGAALFAKKSDYINENVSTESRRIERAENTESNAESSEKMDYHEFNKLNSHNDDSPSSSLRDSANAESWQSTQSHEVPQNQHSKRVESKESSLRDLTTTSRNPQNNDNPTQSQKDSTNPIESSNEADFTALKALLSSLPTPPKDGWERVRIQNIAEKLSAGGDKPKVFSETKTETCQIPIYANAVEKQGLYGYTDKPTIMQNALTISARGTIGYAVARYEAFYPIVRLIVLIPKQSKANLKFLEVLINNIKIENSGVNIPQLTVPEFSSLQIPLPPLKEQEKIISAIEYIENEMRDLAKILDILESQKSKILQKYL